MRNYEEISVEDFLEAEEKNKYFELEGIARGFSSRLSIWSVPFFKEIYFESLLIDRENSLLLFGEDFMNRLYFSTLLKASSETNIPLNVRGKRVKRDGEYQLETHGIKFLKQEYNWN